MTGISFEEIMFTIMSATQDTFNNYLGVEIFAGKVERKVDPVDSDVVGIVGVAGDRVGYILLAADSVAAVTIAKELLMLDEPDEESIRDAIGELTNNIAGVFKTKYHEQYGSVALGLPLIVSGMLRTVADTGQAKEEGSSMNVQCKGVTIPFKSLDGRIALRVMVYM
ncbi:chemotaxis protein CheX [Geotalea uraniireducens]|uniref:Chemotaxis protein CheX n=1 Tax=Geotalea uraniireducens TaxID=351604 RepID=A0ABM8EMP7_9BACT|nr:chemotaxis protein CheX [Geotalea uraniireducens]BDV43704.1 chemotaxis protein CheX [Geotalea uraniireducens]